MSLTVCYITSRLQPRIRWFLESLHNQGEHVDEIIIVDFYAANEGRRDKVRAIAGRDIIHVEPKPTVWQGPHRLTKENFWAASNARNTGICMCRADWIAFVDDRSVLLPGWSKSVHQAITGNYAVFGAYQKRHSLIVQNGIIVHGGIVTGEDSRERYIMDHRNGEAPSKCPGEWAFGCNLALPLEWALQVNGYEELMDGLSVEDVVFGKMLENNGFDLRYDRRMKIIEDRTVSELGTPMLRTSKEKHPHDETDKGHAALKRFCGLKRTEHHWNLRSIRESVLREEPFPHHNGQPEFDWFDRQKISEMTAL